jgi:hypothetical protein
MQEILVGNNKSCQAQGTFTAIKNEGHKIILFREVCKTFKEIHHFSYDTQVPF